MTSTGHHDSVQFKHFAVTGAATTRSAFQGHLSVLQFFGRQPVAAFKLAREMLAFQAGFYGRQVHSKELKRTSFGPEGRGVFARS